MNQTNTEVEVIEVHLSLPSHRRGHDNHRRIRSRSTDLWEEQLHKQEICQVIDSQLALKSILCLAVRREHYTGDADKVVDVRHIFQLSDGVSHGAQVTQVQVEKASLHIWLG